MRKDPRVTHTFWLLHNESVTRVGFGLHLFVIRKMEEVQAIGSWEIVHWNYPHESLSTHPKQTCRPSSWFSWQKWLFSKAGLVGCKTKQRRTFYTITPLRSSHNKTRRPVENFLETSQKRKRTEPSPELFRVRTLILGTQDTSISLGTTEVLNCLLTNSHSQPFSQKTLPMHVTWDQLVKKQTARYPFKTFLYSEAKGWV